MQLIEVTDGQGRVIAPEWLIAAEATHRQLRPQLPADYAAKMQRVFAQGGRMVIAVDGEAVLGVAVWRVYENTHQGMQVYVDDLVTDDHHRSQGVGAALIEWLSARSRMLSATALTLDSGTQRIHAHRFYLRERFDITSFHFNKKLD
ncbi:MAG: GNAT family N-acetyltransferase [Pseudomonadota bacterium]